MPALTAHVDFYRTFCQLAGVEIPADIQPLEGRTLLPLLKDPKAPWEDRQLFVHQGRWEKGADPNTGKFRNFAVRTARWRWVNRRELYDISVDPFEATNVADQHPDVIARLSQAYDAWWAETLPLMVNEQAPYTKEQPQAVRYEKQLRERGIPKWEPLPF